MLTERNGQYTAYASREEGGKETQGQEYLFSKACSSIGSDSTEAFRRGRIIRVENTAKEIKPFVLDGIASTQEIIDALAMMYNMNTYTLGFRISNKRQGVVGRVFYDGLIPYEVDEVWVNLYLKKHPRI